MKFKTHRPKRLSVVSIDGNRRSSLTSALTRASEQNRRKELANAGKDPSPLPPKTTKLTIKLNRANNLRGTKSTLTTEQAQKIRAMRKFYNKQMPTPQCSGCAYASNCPKFRAGYECAFLPFLQSHNIDSVEDLRIYMRELVGANIRRVHMATIMETLAGGKPDLELSEQFALLHGQLKDLDGLERQSEGDMTLETTDTGIIAQLFGNLTSLVAETSKAVDEPIGVPLLECSEHSSELTENGPSKGNSVVAEVLDDFTRLGLEKGKSKSHGPEIVSATLKKAST